MRKDPPSIDVDDTPVDRRPRPTEADLFPADRAFFLGEETETRADRPPAHDPDGDEDRRFAAPYPAFEDDTPAYLPEAYPEDPGNAYGDYQDSADDDAETDFVDEAPEILQTHELGDPLDSGEEGPDWFERALTENDPVGDPQQAGYPHDFSGESAGDFEPDDQGSAAERTIRFDPTQKRGARTFDDAYRHSRRVGILKFVLPGVALAGILVFLGYLQFAPSVGDAVVSLGDFDIENQRVTMNAPRISGFEGDKQAYEITAVKAVQDLNDPNVVTMEGISARIDIGGGNVATIDSAQGSYHRKKEVLDLFDGITVETTDGQSAALNAAQVNIKKDRLISHEPVEIATPDGTLNANGMVVTEKGKRILFTGGVRVVYTPPASPDSPAGDDGPAAAAGEGTAPATLAIEDST